MVVPAPVDAEPALGAEPEARVRVGRALVVGAVAVLVAVVVGVAVAVLLALLEVGPAPSWRVGLWLAGLGLLGSWVQQVDVAAMSAGSWQSAVAGAPLLVTAAAAAVAWGSARPARRAPGTPPTGAVVGTVVTESLLAALSAAAAAAVLVDRSGTTVTTANSVGSVTTTDGLALWGAAGGRLGVVPAAALLVGGAWLAGGLLRGPLARTGWRDAVAVLVLPGAVVSVLAVPALWWYLGSWAIPLAAVLLLPLLGTSVLLAAAGAPLAVAVPRLTAGVLDVGTSTVSPTGVAAGLVVALAVATVAGVWRARRRAATPLVPATLVATASCGLAAFALAVVTGVNADLPPGLGGPGRFGVAPVPAALAGALLGAASVLLGTPLSRILPGRRRHPDRRPG